MKTPLWVPVQAVLAMHGELIAEHGGLPGPPRLSDLEAALARPRQQYAYATKPLPLLARLAAAYGYALARSHCFPDGNKRVALSVIDVFLQMNGRELTADEVDAANTMQSVASGDISEEELAAWIESNS